MPDEVSIIRNNWTSLRVGRFTPPRCPIISDNGHLVGHYPLHIPHEKRLNDMQRCQIGPYFLPNLATLASDLSSGGVCGVAIKSLNDGSGLRSGE